MEVKPIKLKKGEEIYIELSKGYSVRVSAEGIIIPQKTGYFNENGYKIKGRRYDVQLKEFHIFD